MALTRSQILAEVEQLKPEEQRALRCDLDEIIQEHLSLDERLSPEWEAEIRRRAAMIESGTAKVRPANLIAEELRQRSAL